MASQTPVTQEFIVKLILRIVLWCVFLGVVGLIGYGIYHFDQETKSNAEKAYERNAQPLTK